MGDSARGCRWLQQAAFRTHVCDASLLVCQQQQQQQVGWWLQTHCCLCSFLSRAWRACQRGSSRKWLGLGWVHENLPGTLSPPLLLLMCVFVYQGSVWHTLLVVACIRTPPGQSYRQPAQVARQLSGGCWTLSRVLMSGDGREMHDSTVVKLRFSDIKAVWVCQGAPTGGAMGVWTLGGRGREQRMHACMRACVR